MGYIFEIYLTKKYVPKDDWQKLINTISNYNGFLKNWKIIITNKNNYIRYFVKTRCSLPATINGLNSFLLKPIKKISVPKTYCTLLSIPKIGSNIIDLINYYGIKNKGNLVYLEINFLKIFDEKIKSLVFFYLKKNGLYKKYCMIYSFPTSLLSADFDGNRRYFYKSSPKYLEINKVIHLLNTDCNNSLLEIDTFPYLQGRFYLNQNSFNFDKHSIIIGASGCGKSKFISLLIKNIKRCESLRKKYKIIVIDPHAVLENDIGGMGRVIDFKSDLDSIDLFINNNEDIVSSSELLLDLLKSLIADQYNSKLERVLRHSIHLLLTAESFNFRNLRRLILDIEFRNDLLKTLKSKLPISVIDFFLSDFNDLKTKSYGEAISPIIAFIDEMEMIPVFNSDYSFDSLKDILCSNFLTVFSLDRIKLGEKVTKTISGLIMQQLLTIVQRQQLDEHVIFIIDEVAVVENPILSRYLSEARKFNLSLILAGQFFSQISEELKNSIFANVVNYYIFRVSKLDANLLVDSFDMKIPLDNSRDRKIKILTELNNRECIVRIDSNGMLLPSFKGYTLDYTSIPRVKKTVVKKNIENNDNSSDVKTKFSVGNNISLKKLMASNSSSRKVVIE